jgi:ATP-dependent RNA helicase RhlE
VGDGAVTFDELGLAAPLLRAVKDAGYEQPTPIQRDAIPPALKGRDIVGCAQTGTGKTAAFTLPILQQLDERAGDEATLKALILTPTRELAAQIAESFGTYGRHLELWHTVIFGGVSDKKQIKELKRGIDVLVATPGRLLDLMGQGYVKLGDIEVFVLDEADRMLDMGFLPDVRRVVRELPKKRQTLFFSATMPEAIRKLADTLLIDPVSVAVAPIATPADRIEQRVYFVDKGDKRRLLVNLLEGEADGRTLVFSRTKHGANKIVKILDRAGLSSAAIHGNKSQGARTRALDGFKNGEIRILVATDIAARGIDVDAIQHVINFDLPNIPETYVHRIGRTARAGAEGIAVSMCDDEERAFLVDIERLIKRHLDRVEDHPFPATDPPPPASNLDPRYRPPAQRAARSGGGPRRQGGGGGNRGRGPRRGGGGGGSSSGGGPRRGGPRR